MKTKLFLLILLFTLPLTVQGQFELQYKTCNTCDTIDFQEDRISEDFGRRPSGSRWHKGLDYSPEVNDIDLGYQLLALQEGLIVQFDYTGYKYITIQTEADTLLPQPEPAIIYAYGHLFRDGNNEVGDFIHLPMLSDPDEQAILHLDDADNVINAIGIVEGGLVVYNGDTLIVTNQVFTGDALGPMGDSGGDFETHLHLHNMTIANHSNLGGNSSLYDNEDYFYDFKDPLEFLNYEAADYSFTIDAVSLTYLPNDYSSIKVRCAIEGEPTPDSPPNKRYDTAMDIDDLELFIKKSSEDNSNYKLIKGVWLDGKISHGARFINGNTIRYPSAADPPHNIPPTPGSEFPFGGVDIAHYDGTNTCGGLGIGCVDRTGYNSKCYNTYPYDDFYFSDIKLRIHQDDAFFEGKTADSIKYAAINEDARYPDGWYDLYAKATTVRNIVHHSDTIAPDSILIDNFRPYLKTVSINELAGSPLYFANWTWNATDTLLEYGPLSNPFANNQIVTDGTQDISILVQASEPLDTLQLLLDGSTPPTTLFSTDDGTTWFIELTAATLAGLSSFQFLHFTGQDLAENDLLHT